MTVPSIPRFMLFLKDLFKIEERNLDLSYMPPNYFLYNYEVADGKDQLCFFGQEIIADSDPLVWGVNLSAALRNPKYPETQGFLLFVCVNHTERDDPEQDFIVAVHYNKEENSLDYFEMDIRLEDYKPLTDVPTWFEDIDFSKPFVVH